ncbi:MAG TPA: hypothetical protein VGI48_12345 [Caldimonas sp.]|jgi:hypothetical protein
MLARHARRLEMTSMAAMLLGIVFLCQPWSEFLHRYSILTIIVGLVAFNVFSRIASPSAPDRP